MTVSLWDPQSCVQHLHPLMTWIVTCKWASTTSTIEPPTPRTMSAWRFHIVRSHYYWQAWCGQWWNWYFLLSSSLLHVFQGIVYSLHMMFWFSWKRCMTRCKLQEHSADTTSVPVVNFIPVTGHLNYYQVSGAQVRLTIPFVLRRCHLGFHQPKVTREEVGQCTWHYRSNTASMRAWLGVTPLRF